MVKQLWLEVGKGRGREMRLILFPIDCFPAANKDSSSFSDVPQRLCRSLPPASLINRLLTPKPPMPCTFPRLFVCLLIYFSLSFFFLVFSFQISCFLLIPQGSGGKKPSGLPDGTSPVTTYGLPKVPSAFNPPQCRARNVPNRLKHFVALKNYERVSVCNESGHWGRGDSKSAYLKKYLVVFCCCCF